MVKDIWFEAETAHATNMPFILNDDSLELESDKSAGISCIPANFNIFCYSSF
jgi:hypothetical protein